MEINYVFAGSNESSESDGENEEMARAAQTPGYFEEQQQIKDRFKNPAIKLKVLFCLDDLTTCWFILQL